MSKYLQPAAGLASVSGTISGIGDAAAGVISGIRSGAIALEVSDVDDWLRRFNDLIEVVDMHHAELVIMAQYSTAGSGLGDFELSRQIAAKIADRTGSAEGGFAWAMDEVVKELRNIHQALSDAKDTLVTTNDAIADNLNRIAPADPETPHGG